MNEIENTLRTLLRNNIVAFTFRKKNGEIRHAIGTRNLTLAENYTGRKIPTPTGNEQPTSYYDLERDDWRSWKEGNVINIDGCKMGWRATELGLRSAETPKREIPVQKPVSESKPTGGGADIDKLLGGFLGGFGGGIPKEEIRKAMDDLDKDIVIGAPAHTPKVGTPVSGGKVGTPTFTENGLELEMGISVEDFAKMVAHYAVEEFISRIKSTL